MTSSGDAQHVFSGGKDLDAILMQKGLPLS
jgi:hypothetical protein